MRALGAPWVPRSQGRGTRGEQSRAPRQGRSSSRRRAGRGRRSFLAEGCSRPAEGCWAPANPRFLQRLGKPHAEGGFPPRRCRAPRAHGSTELGEPRAGPVPPVPLITGTGNGRTGAGAEGAACQEPAPPRHGRDAAATRPGTDGCGELRARHRSRFILPKYPAETRGG